MCSGLTIISSDESIAVRPPLAAIHVLLGFLQRNVHVSIHRLQFTYAQDESVGH